MRKYISWGMGVLFLGIFAVNTIDYVINDGPEIGFFTVISLIAGMTMFIVASDKSYNASIDNIKRLDGVGHISIEKFYEALAPLETPLGKPWIGGLTIIKRPCIIWGPNTSGEYVYAYKTRFTGSLYIAYNELPSFIKAPKGQEWRLYGGGCPTLGDDYHELICYKLDLATMLDDLRDRCLLYKQNRPLPPMPKYRQGTLYRFDEDFRWTGQDFTLCDIDGNPIYKVTGTMPLKTFRIYDVQDGAERMRITKRLLHILPHYDFYIDHIKIGTLRKRLDYIHDRYTIHTSEGVVELQSVTATFGDNFLVHRNGEIIGTIAEKLNLTLENIVFDNFVIHVRDKRDDLLLTALAVMVARGQARRRSTEYSSNDE